MNLVCLYALSIAPEEEEEVEGPEVEGARRAG